MNITEYIQKLQQVKNEIPIEVSKIIYTNEIQIIDLNREEQIYKQGIGVLGNPLGNYQGFKTGQGKGFPKNRGDRFNLYDTGALYDSFEIKTDGHKLTISNSDSKVGLLEAKVGEFIGLTPDSQDKMNNQIILPKLQEFLNNRL